MGLSAALNSVPREVPAFKDRISVDDVDLDHLPERDRRRVRKMLSSFSDMWNESLGTIQVKEHRIDLKEGSKLVFSQPYREISKARQAEQAEVIKMLE